MKLDLNLLRVFDELMELRNVSRAADRLGLTQSAISHALARLRDQLGDPLFVRAHGGLRPTRRAEEMAPSIRSALVMMREAVAPSSFEPATTTRLFTISASSYFGVTILPIVIQRARAEAPSARFRIVASSPHLLSDLDEGSVDLALGGFGALPARLRKTCQFHERLVWAGKAGSDFADVADRPRLAFTRPRQFLEPEWRMPSGSLAERIEIVPATTSGEAPVPLTIYDPLSAIAFITTSDLVALIPRQLALRLTDRRGVAFSDARDHDEIEIAMLWHSRTADDPAHCWLRGLMIEAAGALA